MDRTVPTNTRDASIRENPDIERAERKVDRDLARFKSAVDTLADKLDTTSNQVQDTVYKARHPGETLAIAARRARHAAALRIRAYKPTYDHYKNRSSRAVSRAVESVRENRAPILLTVAGFLGAWLTSAFVMRRQKNVVVTRVRPARRIRATPPAPTAGTTTTTTLAAPV